MAFALQDYMPDGTTWPHSKVRAFDCWGCPNGVDIQAAGLQAIGLYVPYPGSLKSPNRANLEDLTNHGIYWFWIFEMYADDPERGAPQARQDFETAATGLESVGLNYTDRVVYYTNDSTVTNEGEVIGYYEEIQYLASTTSAFGGMYANDTVYDWMLNPATGSPGVDCFFQTGAGSQYGISPHADIYQGAPSDVYGYQMFNAFGRPCDADGVFTYKSGLENLNGPWGPSAPPEVHKKMMWIDTINGGHYLIFPEYVRKDGNQGAYKPIGPAEYNYFKARNVPVFSDSMPTNVLQNFQELAPFAPPA